MLLWLLIYIFLFGFCRGVNSYIVPFFFRGGGQPAAGGWCPAAGSRLFDNGTGVVLGVVAEGDFGNVYTLTYRQ